MFPTSIKFLLIKCVNGTTVCKVLTSFPQPNKHTFIDLFTIFTLYLIALVDNIISR